MDNPPTTVRSPADPSGGRSPVLVALHVGQHLIAALLTVLGTVRAIAAGTAPGPVITAGLGFAAWYTAGALLAPRYRDRRLAGWWLVGLGVVWAATVVVSSEFVWLAFLLWLLAGHLLRLTGSVVFSLAVFVVVVGAPVVRDGTTGYGEIIGPFVGGLFALGISRGYIELTRQMAERERLVVSLTQAQRETAALQEELARSQRHSGAVAERARLSRDIHDTIAQALSSIRLLAHAAADRTGDAEARQALRRLESLAQHSLVDVRRIVAALTPSELDDDALAAALRRMLLRLTEETGVVTELHTDDSLPTLPTGVEVALLRTAQSALANVRWHAAAHRVVVSLIDGGDTVRMDILDDGRGFDVAAWQAGPTTEESSYGLRLLRSRLRELGGDLEIESEPGEGTALSAHLPIHIATTEEPA